MSAKPSGYGGIIEKDEPLSVEATLEDSVHHPLEVLRTVKRSEGKAHREIDPRNGDHSEDFAGPFGVGDVIEPPHSIEHSDQPSLGHFGLLIIPAGNEEHAAECPGVDTAIVNDHPQLRLSDHEGGRSPVTLPLL
jgi:hypothetical protein